MPMVESVMNLDSGTILPATSIDGRKASSFGRRIHDSAVTTNRIAV